MPGALRVDVQLEGSDTAGAFCLIVDHPPPGWSLPTHRHENESETIYVIEGRFEIAVTGTRRVLGPGDVAHVPRGVEHSGAALGDRPGRRVLVFAPADMERFFLKPARLRRPPSSTPNVSSHSRRSTAGDSPRRRRRLRARAEQPKCGVSPAHTRAKHRAANVHRSEGESAHIRPQR
jgi:oxalate decarboxylase/phosphoglucose isomerase-like protein (cupin superfamily)